MRIRTLQHQIEEKVPELIADKKEIETDLTDE